MLGTAKRTTRTIFSAVLFLAFILFAVDNRETAHVSLFPLGFVADMPLFLFAIFCFFFGAVGGYVCCLSKSKKYYGLLKAEQKKAAGLENQLKAEHAERTPASIAITSL